MKYAPRHFHAFVGYRKHSLSRHMLLLSCFSCVQLFATLWTIAHQAPLPKWFSRQEYWSGLPCPPPGDLPGPGIELASQAGSLPLVPPGKPYSHLSQSHALGSQKKETESLTLRSSWSSPGKSGEAVEPCESIGRGYPGRHSRGGKSGG